MQLAVIEKIYKMRDDMATPNLFVIFFTRTMALHYSASLGVDSKVLKVKYTGHSVLVVE